MKKLFVLGAVIFLLSSCKVVSIVKYVKSLKTGSVEKSEFFGKENFELRNNLVLMKVTIKGKEYTFMFDTGAPPTALSEELVTALGLKKKKKGYVGDSQKNRKTISILKVDTITIAGVKFFNSPCIESDLSHFSNLLCTKIDGIIGNSLMRKAIWAFDFEENLFTLTNQKNKVPAFANMSTIPFTVGKYDFTPSINFKHNNNTYSGYLSIDMGKNGDIDFGKMLSKKAKEKWVANYYSFGNSAVGLFGQGQRDTTFYLANQKVEFAGFTLPKQTITYNKKGHTLLGMGILKNYNLVLNWFTKEISFAKIKEQPQQQPKLGFAYRFENRSCIVSEILYPSNAAAAGLQLGDSIISINGLQLHGLTDSEVCLLKSKQIHNEVVLKINRNGLEKELKFEKTQ
jgi:hypothetical protein